MSGSRGANCSNVFREPIGRCASRPLRVKSSESGGMDGESERHCSLVRSLSQRLMRASIDGVDRAMVVSDSWMSSNRYPQFIVSQIRKTASITAKRRYPDCLKAVCLKSLTYLRGKVNTYLNKACNTKKKVLPFSPLQCTIVHINSGIAGHIQCH